MKAVLSIDFDFFVREEMEWDWQHSESMGDWIWVSRGAAVLSAGIDPMSLVKSNPETFFAKLIGRRLSFDGCKLLAIADSHAVGASFYKTAAQHFCGGRSPLLVNFDAHHDLGYHPRAQLKKLLNRHRAEAGSWAWQLLAKRRRMEYEVIYPRWKGLAEIQGSNLGTILTRAELDRCRFYVEDAWFARDEPLEVVAVLLVRSGAWTPPWFDPVWIDFVQHGVAATGETPLELWKGDGASVLTPRKWDWSASEQIAAFTREARNGGVGRGDAGVGAVGGVRGPREELHSVRAVEDAHAGGLRDG